MDLREASKRLTKLARKCYWALNEKARLQRCVDVLVAEANFIIAKAKAEGRDDATPQEEQRISEINEQIARHREEVQRIMRIGNQGIADSEQLMKEMKG